MNTINTFYCHHCNRVKSYKSDITSGYALDHDNNKVCFDCCAVIDRESMIDRGDSKSLPLYLAKASRPPLKLCPEESYSTYEVTNWCGTLRFKCGQPRKGRHNIAGSRHDVWFHGPDGHVWHGVQFGEWTQVCHCKRTKERWAA
jgi:hypothetical protein